MRVIADRNWKAINDAVNHRMSRLRLNRAELAARMGRDTKTVTNLRTRTVGDATLERASEALEWPPDGLALIGQGTDPDDLPDRPFVPPTSTADTALSVVSEVKRQLDRMESRVRGLTERVGQLESQRPPDRDDD